jgi:hypothetical protein
MRHYRVIQYKNEYGENIKKCQRLYLGFIWVTCLRSYSKGAFTTATYYWAAANQKKDWMRYDLIEYYYNGYVAKEIQRQLNKTIKTTKYVLKES